MITYSMSEKTATRMTPRLWAGASGMMEMSQVACGRSLGAKIKCSALDILHLK